MPGIESKNNSPGTKTEQELPVGNSPGKGAIFKFRIISDLKKITRQTKIIRK